MQSKQEEMSREEIIKYVDELIEANKKSYDKRISPLLYEFFLRANEKFKWSRETFLKKYYNFTNNVKKIKFKKLEENVSGYFLCLNKVIYINKSMLKYINKNEEKDEINFFIDNIFHECLHATDLTKCNRRVVSDRTL